MGADPSWNLPNYENDYRSVVGANIQDQPFVAHAIDFKGYFDMFDGGNVGLDAIGSFKRIGNTDQSYNYCSGGNGCWAHHGDDLFKRVTEWPPANNPSNGDKPSSSAGYGAVIYSDIIGAHTYQAFFGTPQVISPEPYDFDHHELPPWMQAGWQPGDPWDPAWDDWQPAPIEGRVKYWKWAEASEDGPGRATRRYDRIGPRGIKFDWYVRGNKNTDGPSLKSLALAYWTPPVGLINHLSDDLIAAIPDLIQAGRSADSQTAISRRQSIEFFTAHIVNQLENPSKVESKLLGELASMFEDTQEVHIPNKVWSNFVNYVDDSHPDKDYWLNLPENQRARSFIYVYTAARTNLISLERAVDRATAKAGRGPGPLGGILNLIVELIISVIIAAPIIIDKLKGQIKRMGIYYCAPLVDWGKPAGEFYESNNAIRWDDTSASKSMYHRGTSYYCMNDQDWNAVQQRTTKLFIGIVVQLTQIPAADIGIKRNKYFHMMNLGFVYDKSTYGDEIVLPPRQRIDQPDEATPAKYCGILGNAFWGIRRPYAIGDADNNERVEVWPHGFENGFRSKNEGLGTLGDLHNLTNRLDSFFAQFDKFDGIEDVKEWLESLAPIIEDIQEKAEAVLAFIEYIQENKGHIKDEIINAVTDWWNSLTIREQAQIIQQITELLSGIIGDQEMIADFTVMKDSGFTATADSDYSNSIFLSDYGVNGYDSVYQEFFTRSFDTVVLTDSVTIEDLNSGDSAIDSDFRSAMNSYFGSGGYPFGVDSLDSNSQPAWWRPDYIHHSQDSDLNIWSSKDSYDIIYNALLMAGYDSAGERIAPDYLYDSFGRLPWIRNLR